MSLSLFCTWFSNDDEKRGKSVANALPNLGSPPNTVLSCLKLVFNMKTSETKGQIIQGIKKIGMVLQFKFKGGIIYVKQA